MKTLHLDTGNEWRGGQQQVLYLTQGLLEIGVTSVVATPQGSPLAQQLHRRNLPVLELPYSTPWAPKTVRAMQRLLADRSWNVLHMHTSHAHTLGFLSLRLPPPRPFKKPAFVVSRRVDFIPKSDPLSRLKYTSADQFYICVSDAIQQILSDYGIPNRGLYTVRSGVAIPSPPLQEQGKAWRRKLRKALEVPEKSFLLGSIGQFVPHKGHRYLLDAFAIIRKRVPSAHLVLIGDGELEEELKRQASELGIKNAVCFAGYLPRATRYLPALDLFIHASIEEGLGTSILDAEAAGLPVVASRAGGIPETIQDGTTGLLVEPRQPGPLADAVVGLYEDEARRRRMAEAGKLWVAAHHSERLMVERTLSVYQDILGKIDVS